MRDFFQLRKYLLSREDDGRIVQKKWCDEISKSKINLAVNEGKIQQAWLIKTENMENIFGRAQNDMPRTPTYWKIVPNINLSVK